MSRMDKNQVSNLPSQRAMETGWNAEELMWSHHRVPYNPYDQPGYRRSELIFNIHVYHVHNAKWPIIHPKSQYIDWWTNHYIIQSIKIMTPYYSSYHASRCFNTVELGHIHKSLSSYCGSTLKFSSNADFLCFAGGYYTAKTKYGIRIIALNTNLYNKEDKETDKLSDPADQFAWLDHVLDKSEEKSEKVQSSYI